MSRGTIRRRLQALEARRGQARRPWFDIAVWKAERAEGVSLAEQERRRLAECPAAAREILGCFATWRQRRADLDALLEELEA